MNRLFVVLMALGWIWLGTQSAQASMLLADANTEDIYTNPYFLQPSNEATEEAWLEALLGLTYNDQSVNFYDKIEAMSEEYPSGVSFANINEGVFEYDPGFAWDYAVVKIGQGNQNVGDHFAFVNDDGTSLLSFDFSIYGDLRGVSHITFFTGTADTPVPEPTTMLLFGAGIIGLAGMARRKRS